MRLQLTRDKQRGATSRTLWLVCLLPAVTVLAFGLLSILSFVEIRSKRPQPVIATKPVSTEILERYAAENRGLGTLREEALSKVTVESVIKSLSLEDAAEIPSAEKLLSQVRALAKRGAAQSLLRAAIPLWKKAERESCNVRRSRTEGVLVQSLLLLPEESSLSRGEKDELLEVLERCAAKGGDLGGVIILSLHRVRDADDLPRLRRVRSNEKLSAQVAHELDRLIRETEKTTRVTRA